MIVLNKENNSGDYNLAIGVSHVEIVPLKHIQFVESEGDSYYISFDSDADIEIMINFLTKLKERY